ncbi:MAG: hypothetical protein WCN21_05470 [Comamonadaceae bacterium]
MALNTQLADATVNAQADALAALCNSGMIRIYDGTQPATADTATSSNTLGVTLTFGATAFGSASSGLLTANAITAGTAVAAITPTWARILKSDGTTVVMDVSAGASGCNLTIGPFTAGTVVSATSFTHDVRNSTSGY